MRRRAFLATSSAAMAAGCAGVPKRAVEDRWPPVGNILELDGLKVHYWDAGSGPPVVLVHGASGNLRDFTFALAPRLARRHRVIAFDRPGFGYSDRLPGNGSDPRAQAAHLARATRQLGADRPVVLGHSWGGALAMAWAVAAGETLSGVVSLAGATMPWGGDLAFFYSLVASGVTGPGAAWVIHKSLSETRINDIIAETFAPQQVPTGYAAHIGGPLATRPATLRHNARDLTGLNRVLEELALGYGHVQCPVEILHGTADTIVPAQIHAKALHEKLPISRLTLLDGVGHMPHHAMPQAVEAAIDRLGGR